MRKGKFRHDLGVIDAIATTALVLAGVLFLLKAVPTMHVVGLLALGASWGVIHIVSAIVRGKRG